MATRSGILAWRAIVHGVAKSRSQLKWLGTVACPSLPWLQVDSSEWPSQLWYSRSVLAHALSWLSPHSPSVRTLVFSVCVELNCLAMPLCRWSVKCCFISTGIHVLLLLFFHSSVLTHTLLCVIYNCASDTYDIYSYIYIYNWASIVALFFYPLELALLFSLGQKTQTFWPAGEEREANFFLQLSFYYFLIGQKSK